MHVSQRYRDSAAECLLAAEEASQPHRRKLHLSMAISWLSLARKYEAIEHLFQEEPERLPYSREPTTLARLARMSKPSRHGMAEKRAPVRPSTRNNAWRPSYSVGYRDDGAWELVLK
jgi:hypothetical protein